LLCCDGVGSHLVDDVERVEIDDVEMVGLER